MRRIATSLLFLVALVGNALAWGTTPSSVNVLNPQVSAPAGSAGLAPINDNFAAGGYPVAGGVCSEWGHRVPCTNHVSTSRASTGLVAASDGTWSSVSANVSRLGGFNGFLIEEARTNGVRNSTGGGGSAPSTFPTYWAGSSTLGITTTYVGAGTEYGLPYVDVSISGTASGGTGTGRFYFDNGLTIAASNGQVWTHSAFMRVVAGSTSNFLARNFTIVERTSGGAYIGEAVATTVAPTATFARYTLTGTLSGGATTAFIQPSMLWTVSNGNTVDVTLRIYVDQLELGAFATSPIITITAAATRAADVPQLIGPALTAALAAKSAFFQTSGLPDGAITGGNNSRWITWNTTNGYVGRAANNTQIFLTDGSGNTATATIGSGSVQTALKISANWGTAPLGIKGNDGSLVTSAAAFSPSSGSVYLGNQSAGNRALNGYMQRFALSPIKGVFDGATAP